MVVFDYEPVKVFFFFFNQNEYDIIISYTNAQLTIQLRVRILIIIYKLFISGKTEINITPLVYSDLIKFQNLSEGSFLSFLIDYIHICIWWILIIMLFHSLLLSSFPGPLELSPESSLSTQALKVYIPHKSGVGKGSENSAKFQMQTIQKAS